MPVRNDIVDDRDGHRYHKKQEHCWGRTIRWVTREAVLPPNHYQHLVLLDKSMTCPSNRRHNNKDNNKLVDTRRRRRRRHLSLFCHREHRISLQEGCDVICEMREMEIQRSPSIYTTHRCTSHTHQSPAGHS